MRTHVDRDVDSNCFAPDRDSDRIEDRCGEDATTYVRLPSGISRYVCPDHADEVDRFGETKGDHPKTGVCERCRKLTTVNNIDPEADVCVECIDK